MFNSVDSSRFNCTLRAAGLAVTIASLAAAGGSTTDTPATQAAVALRDLTTVAEPSPAPEPGQGTQPQPDSAVEPAGQTDQQPGEESHSTSTQPPTQPETSAPDGTTTPTPTDPANVLEIPEGATVEVLGSNRLPGHDWIPPLDCIDSAGNTHPHNDVVSVDPYGPGRSTLWICEDGVWRKLGPGGDTPEPLEDPPGEGPEIELDQADLDPPTDVFEAPVSN